MEKEAGAEAEKGDAALRRCELLHAAKFFIDFPGFFRVPLTQQGFRPLYQLCCIHGLGWGTDGMPRSSCAV